MQRLIAMIVFSCAGLSISDPAAAATRAEQILAQAKAASGGAAWDNLTTVMTQATIETGGLNGTAESYEDWRSGNFAQSFTLGVASGSQGYDGKIVWSTDSSGQPRVESGLEAVKAAINNAYRTSRSYWYSDRIKASYTYAGTARGNGESYDDIQITPEGGRPFDFWINKRSHRIEKMIEVGDVDTNTETYRDFRTVNNIILPYQTRTSTGQAKYDQISQIASITFGEPIPPEKFGLPKPPADDFAFPTGQTSVTLPFQLINNHVYFDVSLNGGPKQTFLFDTGAINVIDKSAAERMKLSMAGALPGGGVGEAKEDLALARLDTVDLGGIVIKNQVFISLDQKTFGEVEGLPSAGIVGYEIAKRMVVEIDYAKSQISFIKRDAFQPPADAVAVPFQFDEHNPQVDGSIDGITGKFNIDTGSRNSLTLLAPFVESHHLIDVYKPKYKLTAGWGVGGPAKAQMARARELKLGDVVVPAPVVDLSGQKKGAFSSPYYIGNVGGGVLKRFTLTLDYGNQKLYFAKNANYDAPDIFDRSGLWLNREGTILVVMDVAKEGPGMQARLKIGDHVLSIDDQPVTNITLADVRTKLKAAPGTQVKFAINREGQEKTLTVTLADLI